jgi:hypothetical protein
MLGRAEEMVPGRTQGERHLLEQRKKKDLSKVKCFACHEHGHYASQCPQQKKGSRKQHASSIEVDVVADRLQREFLLVSALSGEVFGGGTWFVDSGATCHMTGARELFESFTESDSDLYVELGMGTKHAVQGSGTMSFQMESGDVLRVTNVLWVPKLRKSVLSVSTIEEKGYAVLFRDGQVLFMPRGSSSDTTMVLGVRESNLYRLKGQPMRAMASNNRVTEDKEQVAPKVVQTQRESDFRGSHPSGFGGKEEPSKSVKRKLDFRGSIQAQRESQSSRGSQPSGSGGREESSKTVRKVSWVEEARQEAQKREASRSRVSSKKGPCHSTRIASVSVGATVVADPVSEAEPLPVWETDLLPGDGGWNTSLAKREC